MIRGIPGIHTIQQTSPVPGTNTPHRTLGLEGSTLCVTSASAGTTSRLEMGCMRLESYVTTRLIAVVNVLTSLTGEAGEGRIVVLREELFEHL